MSNTFTPLPPKAPPASTVGAWGWVRENLLSTPFNIAMTALGIIVLYLILPPMLDWAIFSADFLGSTYEDCENDGACWVFVKERLPFFIYGFFPAEQYWRIDLMFLLVAITFVPQFFQSFPFKKSFGIFALTGLPILSGILMMGGIFGLEPVETDRWGGLSLTLVLAYVGIVASLPFGILLALGRRSKMPAIKIICIGFIELWRGVPLISVLFMASVMLPLFMPEGVNFDKLMRALIGIVMFQSAYMAEVIRGGLQAIPKGQYEAASALGLNYWKSMWFIILPQALKLVIPGIVNTFIALFKDTTLVLIIGLFDVLNAVKSAIIDPAWGNVATEGYMFAAFAFFVFCYGMSRYSLSLEKRLDTGHKR